MRKKMTFTSPRAAISSALVKLSVATTYMGDAWKLLQCLPSSSVDLVFSSPPYCMGKEYEDSSDIADFIASHKLLLPELVRVLKTNGSLCWQVGNHAKNGVVTPLDSLVYCEMLNLPEMKLRNRIVWSIGHGLHCSNRFSGRHESILWYTKGDDYVFNLDAVRVAQKYPGKVHSKGPNKGNLSGNPLGKNPGDVWEIPNVKANHAEKTSHPCQFPVALPQIFIRALTSSDDLIFDPFMGSGSSGVAAIAEGRRFLGCELEPSYVEISESRLRLAIEGKAPIRPWNQSNYEPGPNEKVARRPSHFRSHEEQRAIAEISSQLSSGT
jgi:adenine-specific DNA-methyltransferase